MSHPWITTQTTTNNYPLFTNVTWWSFSESDYFLHFTVCCDSDSDGDTSNSDDSDSDDSLDLEELHGFGEEVMLQYCTF